MAKKKSRRSRHRKQQGRSLSQSAPRQPLIPEQIQQIAQALQQAVQLHKHGRLQAAQELYTQILQFDPDHADASYLLGTSHYQLGRNDLALPLLEKALKLNPANINAHINLGVVLKTLGRYEEAIATYNAALHYQPDNPSALNNLGVSCMGLQDPQRAMPYFRKALQLEPTYTEAHNNLGRALEALGQLDEAASSYQRAVELKPDCGEAHLALSWLNRDHDEHMATMLAQYDNAKLEDRQRMYLAFALGKCFEDQQQYDRAFEYFREANRLQRATISFDLATQTEHFRNLKHTFDREFFERSRDPAHTDSTPIFVLGMPRSGTSLVEQILASHSQVFGAGELPYLHSLYQQAAKEIAGQDKPAIDRLARQYLRQLKQHHVGGRYIVDKMPQNFLYIGMIRYLLPGARIIHCRRDALDTCLSIYKKFFVSHHPYAYDLEELGAYYQLYEELMEHWCSLFPKEIYNIDYEQLVVNPKQQIEALLAHCGLEFEPACIAFHETERVVTTASAAQVRQPMYENSIRAWGHYEQQLQALKLALQA